MILKVILSIADIGISPISNSTHISYDGTTDEYNMHPIDCKAQLASKNRNACSRPLFSAGDFDPLSRSHSLWCAIRVH